MTKIEDERIILRDYIHSDLEDLHRLLSDKKNMYYLDDIATSTIEESEQNLKAAMANCDGHYFIIIDRETGGFIGTVGYTITASTPIGKVVHMGYFILPEHHGRGYTARAAKMALKFAFESDGCVRVTTGCYGENTASRKVMEKAGFKKEGEHIKAAWHDGRMKDRLDYAINKEDFCKASC